MRTLLLALLAVTGLSAAEQILIDQGFNHFYNLEYEEAIANFREAISRDPNSADLHNHLAETLSFREMFRNGALESEMVNGNNAFLRRPKFNPTPEIEREFLGEVEKAMSLSQAALARNPNDTKAMYALGVAYGQRCNWFWLVHKAWRDSLKDATTARRLHNRISELEPSNVDARMMQGLHDYLVGSLPFHIRMLGFLMGIRGDKDKGIRAVQLVAKSGNLNKVDAQFFLAALYRRENQTARAVPIVQELIQRYPRNYLLRLELSQMYSMAGDGKAALDNLDQLTAMKRTHVPGYDRMPWEKVWFQRGVIQFWYRDWDHALENLQKVAASTEEIDLNTEIQTWLRIGQIHDMCHRRQQAQQAYRNAIARAPQADAAQEAKKYLSSPYVRPPD